MFGSGKRIPTGASEKIKAANKMRIGGHYNTLNEGPVNYPSQTIPITIVFAVSVIFAFLLSDSGVNPLAGAHVTSVPVLDDFLTSSDISHFTNDPDENKVLTIMGRGGIFFLLTGIPCFLALLLERIFFSKVVMPIVLCWGVISFMVIMHFFVPLDSIIPFFKGIVPFLKSF